MGAGNALAGTPFDLTDSEAYKRWREAKLADYPARLDSLIVEVRDPRLLSKAERAALVALCRKCGMAIYASSLDDLADKEIPRRLGEQLGLTRLDANFLADQDGISSLAVATHAGRGEFIPYTDRPIRWHTDGYYNPPDRQIHGLILHCVSPATQGGANALLDHEVAYILLRDANPEFIHALMADDVMTIPPRMDDSGEARAAQPGPVFAVRSGGHLHMRYTARKVSIDWKQDALTLAAVAHLEGILSNETPWTFHGRLESGMGLICNNVLHDRSGFTETESSRRLLYRARYYDRISGT